MCLFRSPNDWKNFPQKSHLWFLCPSWTFLMWVFRFPELVKDCLQESHLTFFAPSWKFLPWSLSLRDVAKDLPQILQLWYLILWLFSIWLFSLPFDQCVCYTHCIQKFSILHEPFLCVCLCFYLLKMTFHKFHKKFFLMNPFRMSKKINTEEMI